MNILLLSHERSLNKTEAFLRSYHRDDVYLVCEMPPIPGKDYVHLAKRILVVKNFNINSIIGQLPKIDVIWTVSENLLPVQAQLESYYGIENLTPYAAEILSNKQMFDDFCRLNGLGDHVPDSIIPTFYKQLDRFKNRELFTKPDIGTGSNVFFPGDDQSVPSIEYRRWNNRHHFLSYLKSKQVHNRFFELNQDGIYTERFNYKPCRIMVQEYFWSTVPSICPIGYIKDGKATTLFYVKNSKIKYGDKLSILSDPIESHSVSKLSDIVRERAVWIVTADEIPQNVKDVSENFLQTVADKLKIRNMFFSGPDFHICDNRIIAIDFNPRTGQFINILDRVNDGDIIKNAILGQPVQIKKKLLWGCAVLDPGTISNIGDLTDVEPYMNSQNTKLSAGMVIPEFQNLQNKAFNVNLNITGENEQELFTNYRTVNQLLQNSISY